MATLLHSESRRLYSWWWDSHISPKNSKWLQENLKDMDSKVKSMIKLIEEDADSFARRAEMYYKKRPELMKLVEEFYRAYRALAERYDHATGELRQAHRTIAEAFPNHVPDAAVADDLGSDVEPRTPEMPHPFPAFFDADEFRKDVECLSINSFPSSSSEESCFGNAKRGLKQLNEMLGLAEQDHNVMNGESHSLSENQDLRAQILVESERAGKLESELQHLKKTLEAIEAEKVALFHKYDQSLNKLSTLESKLNEVEKGASLCNEQASMVENEIEILNEALIDLEAERDAALLQYNQCVERMSVLEHALFQAQDDAIGLHNRALEAEKEVESLKNDLSVLASEKETGLLQYKQCLGMIYSLEDKIALAEENSRMLSGQNERSEIEVRELKEAISNLNEDKDATEFSYKQCLETITKMENELSCARENIKKLNGEIFDGAVKLKSMEEQHLLLGTSNQCLQKEANHLKQKIADKDWDIREKQRELELIQRTLLQEQSQFHQVEATLLSLQKLHSHSKEEQKALALELENRLQNFKTLEACNFDLKKDLVRVEAENQNLNEVNMTSATSIKNLQDEIINLKDLKEGIEKEVTEQTYRSNGLQQEVDRLKEEIDALNKAYQALLQQLRCAGLNPECVEAYVKQLQKENLDLKEACDKHTVQREVLVTKVEHMDILIDQNANLRSSHSELNGNLEGSKEMVQELQKSCQLLHGEKSALIVEKTTILSQLQNMTDNMQNLLEKNTLLETSLSGANIKLEGLKVKSISLEEMCQFLRNEKSNLENERSTLVSLLQNVEQRLHSLEERFINLEGKFSELEKEKESTVTQLEKLQGFYHEDRKLHACYAQSSELRFAGLEGDVHALREENKLRKKDFEEELDKAIKAQVEMFIFHKFIKDLDEKNSFMLTECQKHVEAAKLSDKLIKELESENLKKQMEVDFLLDEVQRLRKGIHQLFWALHFDQEKRQEEILKQDHIAFPHIIDRIEDLRACLSKDREEKQELLVENSVLLASLGQLKLDGTELELEKGSLAQELMIAKSQKAMLQEEKQKMLKMNKQLTLDVNAKIQHEDVLLTDLESYRARLVDMENAHLVLQKEKSKQLEESRHMHERFLDLKERINVLEEENSSALQETLAFRSLSLVLECFGTEKIDEVQTLCENLGSLQIVNRDLMERMHNLSSELKLKDAESLHLKTTVEELHKELSSARDSNAELNYEFAIGKEFLKQKAVELSEFEERLQSAHNLNSELRETLDLLKREMEKSKYARENLEMHMHQISSTNRQQEEKIKNLQEENGTLVSEISKLQNEIEENKTREENLSLELQDKSNEVEIWDAEAASFYFDFQISAIHEVLLENKVHELTSTCKSLGQECSAKDVQIKEMMSRIDYLECEVGRVQSHLSSYVPVVASLKRSVVSLEKHSHAWTRCTPDCQGKLGSERSHVLGGMDPKETQDQNRIGATGIAGLQEIQMRLKEVEEAIEEHVNNLSVPKIIDASIISDEGKNVRSEEKEQRDDIFHNLKSKLMKPEIMEPRPAISLKDIPLDQVSDSSCYRSHRRQKGSSDDQMLELWETAEQDCGTDLGKRLAQVIDGLSASHGLNDARLESSDLASGIEAENEVAVDKLEVPTYSIEPMRGASSRTLLETLASDGRKLTSIQTTVQELRRKVEMTKRSKRTDDHEHRRVKQQLQELEQATVELANMNAQLTWEVEDSPSSIDMKCSYEQEEAGSTHRKRVAEQTQKESERIGKLQLEVQSLGHIFLKLENERKHKGKMKLSGSRSSALLKGFIHRSDKHRGKKNKKACLCGCRRPSTKED